MDPYLLPTSFLDPGTWDVAATTPKRITPLIEQACVELEPDNDPLFLVVTPLPGARPGWCYQNVAQAGLAARQGWLLWELPGIFVCAEHHCVGLAADGTFEDVTPQVNVERRVLFLPGRDRTQEMPVPNRYWSCGDHPLLHQFIRLKGEADRLIRAGRIAEFKRLDHEIMAILRAYQRLLAKREDNAARKEQRRRRRQKRNR